jgi:DNA polymerase III alpha subunit
MAFAQLEDLKGKIEVIFFPEAFAAVQETLRRALVEAEPILLTGEIEVGEENPKVLAKTLEWAAEVHRGRVQQVVIRLNPSQVSSEQLRELKQQVLQHRGKCPVRIDFCDPKFKTSLVFPKNLGLTATPQLVVAINRIFAAEVVSLS